MTNKTETDINLDESKAPEEGEVLSSTDEASIRDMVDNHVFYGRSKTRTNPKMKPNILSTKSGVEIIDLKKTEKELEKAANFIKEKVKSGGDVLFVGTAPAAKYTIKDIATRLDMPYVTERWLGGTLTNFKTISERVKYFKKLSKDKEAGNLDSYTKKERLKIDEELVKLENFFGGIADMNKLPAVVVIADLGEDDISAREAKKTKIPSIAFVNTDNDPERVDYPIPANNRNSKSIQLLFSTIEKAVEEGKSARESREEKAEDKKEETDRNVYSS